MVNLATWRDPRKNAVCYGFRIGSSLLCATHLVAVREFMRDQSAQAGCGVRISVQIGIE